MILHIRNGQITNTAAWDKYLKDKDGVYQAEVRLRNKRSKNANDYFHSIYLEYFMQGLIDAGYFVRNKDEAKSIFKSLFCKEILDNGSRRVEIIRDTSSLSKDEFSQKLNEGSNFAREYLNTEIPEPLYQQKLEL